MKTIKNVFAALAEQVRDASMMHRLEITERVEMEAIRAMRGLVRCTSRSRLDAMGDDHVEALRDGVIDILADIEDEWDRRKQCERPVKLHSLNGDR